jgi:hypothetical protein
MRARATCARVKLKTTSILTASGKITPRVAPTTTPATRRARDADDPSLRDADDDKVRDDDRARRTTRGDSVRAV